MFDVRRNDDGSLALIGRLDASQADKALACLEAVTESTMLDFTDLAYISSAGLGVLIATQLRLASTGHALRFRNLNKHIGELFKIAGFHTIFDIE
jgi:anti-sigma B factor antagonist